MKNTTTIQKHVAFFLLLVCCISMAPKTFFHQVLAHHNDVSYCTEAHKAATCLHQQAVKCHFDDLVVTAAYLFPPAKSTAIFSVSEEHSATPYCSFIGKKSLQPSVGRAPPCL